MIRYLADKADALTPSGCPILDGQRGSGLGLLRSGGRADADNPVAVLGHVHAVCGLGPGHDEQVVGRGVVPGGDGGRHLASLQPLHAEAGAAFAGCPDAQWAGEGPLPHGEQRQAGHDGLRRVRVSGRYDRGAEPGPRTGRQRRDIFRQNWREQSRGSARAAGGIDEGEWSKLDSATSQPFDPPASGKIAVKVLKVYPVPAPGRHGRGRHSPPDAAYADPNVRYKAAVQLIDLAVKVTALAVLVGPRGGPGRVRSGALRGRKRRGKETRRTAGNHSRRRNPW